MKIEQLNGKIQELQTLLNIKNNSSLNKIKELENTIILKNNEINDLKAKLQNCNNSNQIENNIKDKCVNFTSSDQNIWFAITC